jgi:Fe-S-cluster containining protein
MCLYNELKNYIDDCSLCGECCSIPGILLPEQITILTEHFKLNPRQLLDKYLIAELCAPKDSPLPVFLLSPVKVDDKGERFSNKIIDHDYHAIRDKKCIFLDSSNRCSIHDIKPFGCSMLLCKKMTHGNSICFDKQFYYHRWKDHQQIIFSIFPELETPLIEIQRSILDISEQVKIHNKKMYDNLNNKIGIILTGHIMVKPKIYSE